MFAAPIHALTSPPPPTSLSVLLLLLLMMVMVFVLWCDFYWCVLLLRCFVQEISRMIHASTGHPSIEQDSGIVYEDFLKLVPPLCPTQIFKVCVCARAHVCVFLLTGLCSTVCVCRVCVPCFLVVATAPNRPPKENEGGVTSRCRLWRAESISGRVRDVFAVLYAPSRPTFPTLSPSLSPSSPHLSLYPAQGGSTIYTEGEVDRNFYLINQGEVSLELEGVAPKQGLKLWGRRR